MAKPYTVETESGPLGTMHVVTGPNGYRSAMGGGKDNGRMRAKLEATKLNAAYEAGEAALREAGEEMARVAYDAWCNLLNYADELDAMPHRNGSTTRDLAASLRVAELNWRKVAGTSEGEER